MSERDEKRGGSGCAITGVVLILLPVLYVLSIGPAVWLAIHDYLSFDAFDFIYSPVHFLAERSDWFAFAADWYQSFFAFLSA